MKISVKDFRCFHLANDIEVRPINILVGENSAGKSSFLAAIRFLLDLFRDDAKPTFNKDPFFLGSYDQIAHFRGGKFGRAKEFSFTFSNSLDRGFLQRRSRLADRDVPFDVPDDFDTRVCFTNNRSQPSISQLEFKAGKFGFSVFFHDEMKMILHTPGRDIELPKNRILRDNDPLVYDLSIVDFMLRDSRYFARKADALTESDMDQLQLVHDVYQSTKRALPREVYASAPVRSKPARTYNPGESNPSPDGEHIPFVLSQIKEFDKELWTEVARTLSQFGKASGLFDALTVKRLTNTESGPFQLIVTSGGLKSNIIDVGYGVSQSLPIITDLIRARERSMFLIQQPEVHLHPRAQAELSTFFAQIVKRKHHTLFIETHSDHLIDRLRMEVRDGRNIGPADLSILYFERKGLDVSIHSITVDETGNVRGAPANYRKFFVTEEMKSLGIDP